MHVPLTPPNTILLKPNVPNPYIKESDLSKSIRLLSWANRPTLEDPELRFNINPDATISNLTALQQHEYDLWKMCNRDEWSSTSFGSEFRDVTELDQLFKYHSWWNRLQGVLTDGVNFDLESISDKLRQLDVLEAFHRGNHKSADEKSDFFVSAISKEIKKG